jgi:C4-dicarboxylate-specific signal transduction histidine kinase
VTTEAITAIRTRADLARRLAEETKQAEASAALLQIATMLDADADQLEATARQQSGEELRR